MNKIKPKTILKTVVKPKKFLKTVSKPKTIRKKVIVQKDKSSGLKWTFFFVFGILFTCIAIGLLLYFRFFRKKKVDSED